MLALVIFLLAVYGLATAVAVLKVGRYFLGTGYCGEKDCAKEGHPHEKRKSVGRIPYFGDLFYCPPCLSFWIGMAVSWWVVSPAVLMGVLRGWKSTVTDGLAACAVSWLLHILALRLITRQCKKCGHVDENIPEI